MAEDALAIVVCCSLTATDFTNGVILAANHSGDSDGTAADFDHPVSPNWTVAAIPRFEFSRPSQRIQIVIKVRWASFTCITGVSRDIVGC